MLRTRLRILNADDRRALLAVSAGKTEKQGSIALPLLYPVLPDWLAQQIQVIVGSRAEIFLLFQGILQEGGT